MTRRLDMSTPQLSRVEVAHSSCTVARVMTRWARMRDNVVAIMTVHTCMTNSLRGCPGESKSPTAAEAHVSGSDAIKKPTLVASAVSLSSKRRHDDLSTENAK